MSKRTRKSDDEPGVFTIAPAGATPAKSEPPELSEFRASLDAFVARDDVAGSAELTIARQCLKLLDVIDRAVIEGAAEDAAKLAFVAGRMFQALQDALRVNPLVQAGRRKRKATAVINATKQTAANEKRRRVREINAELERNGIPPKDRAAIIRKRTGYGRDTVYQALGDN